MRERELALLEGTEERGRLEHAPPAAGHVARHVAAVRLDDLAEAQLPAEALVSLADFPLEAVAICADLDHNVFNPTHTDAAVAAALGDTYWYDLNEWAKRGPRV